MVYAHQLYYFDFKYSLLLTKVNSTQLAISASDVICSELGLSCHSQLTKKKKHESHYTAHQNIKKNAEILSKKNKK